MTVIIAEISTTIPNIISPKSRNISKAIIEPSSDFRKDAEVKNRKNNPPIKSNHLLNHRLITGLLSGSFFGFNTLPLMVTITVISFYSISDIMSYAHIQSTSDKNCRCLR